VVRDPFTKESRGFAFVTFEYSDDAYQAVDKTDGKALINGRVLIVEISKRSAPRRSTPGRYLGKEYRR
jgi:RNA recognition motif-containing protein